MLRLTTMLVIAFALVGCAPAEPAEPPGEPTPAPDLPLPSEATAATPWRDTGLPVEFDAEARHLTPEDVVQAVAEAMRTEVAADGPDPRISAEVLDATEASASGRVVAAGFADDSVHGGDYFIALARDEAGWYVDQTWTRDLCLRGVSNGLCL